MDTTIEELPRKETVYSLCHECCPLPIDCRAAGFGVRKFPECLRKPLAEGTKRRLAALALRSLPEDAGVVGEHSVIELADSARAVQNVPRAHRISAPPGRTVSRGPLGLCCVADADVD